MTRGVKYLLLLACLALPVRAGLYDPVQPVIELFDGQRLTPLPHEEFRDRLDALRIAGDPARPNNRPRTEALARRDALLQLPNLDAAQRLQLGLVRLNLRDYDQAMTDLQQAYALNPRDFWVLSALGTAHLQSGQAAEAVRYLEAARDMFPEPWPGPGEQAVVARSLENYLLKLARLRMGEQAGRGPRRSAPPETVDDLFGVRLVGPSGQFEPGQLAPEQQARLPADAVAVVQQLLLWLPDDTRLYWLLGALYAVQGELDWALEILNECLDSRRFDAALLRQHRQAVRDAIAARPAPPDGDDWKPTTRQWLLALLVAGPVCGVLLYWQLRQWFRRPSR